MPKIDIDFDVYKALTARRETEATTYNDVVRSLLGLAGNSSPSSAVAADPSDVWVCKGVRFPVGTEFEAQYKGRVYSGIVDRNGIVVNGQCAASPSDAARLVTKNNVNGWVFWKCRFPGETRWQSLNSLRD